MSNTEATQGLMIDIENVKPHNLRFESSHVASLSTKIVGNLEQFNESTIILVGSDGYVDYYNSRAIDLFELDIENLEERLNFQGLLNFLGQRGDFGAGKPEDVIALVSSLLQPTADKEKKCTKNYLTMPSGNILRVLIFRNDDGSLTISANDVSDKRRDENMLEVALDVGLAGYLIFDTLQKSCRVESRYLSNLLTGAEMDTLKTTGLFPFFHPDDLDKAHTLWKAVKSTSATQRDTLRIVTEKEGVRWLKFVLMPESGMPHSSRVAAFFNDVTDSLRQQEDLRQAKNSIETSLASKEDFLARMSHEIRTPMNAVIGMADALLHHHSNPEIAPQLELMQKSATSILKLLDETLTHSRLGADSFSLDPQPANPTEVVRDVCALWKQQALKGGAEIRCIIKDEVPETIVFDKFRYEQCINNLISNAVKFTQNGQIDVILTVVQKKGAPYLILAVRDTGIGMTVDQQSHIFDAYAQADKSISSRFGGTGLGMNITKQIVDLMGGTISVKSEIGSGSMFAISVPIVDEAQHRLELEQQERANSVPDEVIIQIEPETVVTEPVVAEPIVVEAVVAEPIMAEAIETVPAPVDVQTAIPVMTQPTGDVPAIETAQPNTPDRAEEPTARSLVEDMLSEAKPEETEYSALRILVVDDNPTNHLVVKSLLSSIVGEITVAYNGAEALEALDTTAIDIVLMDIHMPIMDGIECTLAIRRSTKPWKDVTIIALTADPQYQQKQLCINIGMNEALGKPVRLNELLTAIDKVLPNMHTAETVEGQQPNSAYAQTA